MDHLPHVAGHDLPAQVARDWARWCTHPDYLFGEEPEGRARFARFDRPTLLYSFTDDFYAPGAAVDALAQALSGTRVIHRRFAPGELGLERVGHFGFFRPGAEESLWSEARDFLGAVLEGRPSGLVSHAPRSRAWFEVEAADVWADLEVGR